MSSGSNGQRSASTPHAAATSPTHQHPKAPRPYRPKTRAGGMYALHNVLSPNRLWAALASWIEATPPAYRLFTRVEELAKGRLFGCRMCAQCAIPATGYACPMTCPKQLRNGPCGGVGTDGGCEVYPEMRCVWLMAYERAEADGRAADLRRLQRPIDQRKWGESSWINYWKGRDDGLWTEADALFEPVGPDIARAGADQRTHG